jgi:tRNA nucleotidyltransferase (CCA-adding enzyme)
MKVYLVGGALRDKLLNIPVKERDWVVVGATPDELIDKGFKPVGKSFPVFIAPDTQEEYALARKEKKCSPGYYGFSVDFSKDVTLEEDLLRRDLTINAMAMSDDGKIIDPYHGQQDIHEKWLRHVSEAFIEDPVRVLRVARFLARFYHLGFRVHPDTLVLMRKMVREGECHHLVPERIWKEWQKSLTEKNPEQFILVLRQVGALEVILPELNQLFGIPIQNAEHSKDLGMNLVAELINISKEGNLKPQLIFAYTLKDIGQSNMSSVNWFNKPNHQQASIQSIERLAYRLKVPNDYRDIAKHLCNYYDKLQKVLQLTPQEGLDVLLGLDSFRRPEIFLQLLELTPDTKNDWLSLLNEVNQVNVKSITMSQKGEAIKSAIYEARLKTVTSWYCNRV